MQLYHLPLSGHSHRVRLFLSIIGADHKLIEVAPEAIREPEFLKINRFAQVPVLVDGDVIIADSNAILIYLAKKFGKTDWLPEDAAGAAAVQKWLSVAANEIANGPCAARLITVFKAPLNAEQVILTAHKVLKNVDDALIGRDWIALDRPTIADVALYSYIARAPEGNVDTARYEQIRSWLSRVEALPGFFPFVETAAGLNAK
ncbi:glutathione S-transferase family protein [Pseudorhodoplanes sinuspersici]|uniref:Glutathione S-transferase n=1 Tax=Pseudorhodoplanes sinuspersici TaxID=1235591 RepID=A0A1W6ZX56_9HYPH|nr:glutathione S-transferase [Pseudorhodoplanes sinuspersici]ARQ01858.1 glutathione S-transferase [Pseudorhodoplanes sinuspersici]RKE73620.1 glutathione S-transferase [Pseudorhodoplanes sinuspersici]